MGKDTQELEEIAKKKSFTRKVSVSKTEECTVWNRYVALWEESDEHLRNRIKESIKPKENGKSR